MAGRLRLADPSCDALKRADPEDIRPLYATHGSWKPAVIAHRLQVRRDAEPLTSAAIMQPASLDATLLAHIFLHVQ